jgi:hypothetical protein
LLHGQPDRKPDEDGLRSHGDDPKARSPKVETGFAPEATTDCFYDGFTALLRNGRSSVVGFNLVEE